MQKVFLFLQTTGKSFGLLVTLLKYNKFVEKEELSKKINVKQFPTLVEVHLKTGLLSNRSKSMILDGFGTILYYSRNV